MVKLTICGEVINWMQKKTTGNMHLPVRLSHRAVFFLFEDVTGYRDLRRINLKKGVSIGPVVFAAQQHKTNTFIRLIIEIQL